MHAAIEATRLTKRYGDLIAVDAISFEVAPGEVFGLLGPNGAGKTSTIRMLTGLSAPSGGSGAVMGMDVAKRARDVKRVSGVVPERSNLYEELTCLQNLVFVGRLYGVRNPGRRALELLDLFSLSDRRESRFAHLSRGMKRRLTLAASLVHSPKVLFLDEPTIGLDVMSARDLRHLIARLGEGGTTVLLTTHNIEEAGALSARMAIMVAGRVVALDTPENLRSRAGREAVINLTVERAAGAPIEIPPHPSIRSVEVSGAAVAARVNAMGPALSHIASSLERSGFEVRDIASHKPTLEEAFVEITGLSQKEMSAGGRGG